MQLTTQRTKALRVPMMVRAVPAVAERVWWTPPRSKSSTLESAIETNPNFEEIEVRFHDRVLRGYSIGDGPLVILVHGWGGQAAQFAPLAAALATAGFRAVSIDLPGHGGDAQKTSDAFQMAEAIRSVIQVFGEPDVIVAHSLAAMAVRIAFVDNPAPTTVLISPLLSSDEAVEVFSDRAKLLPWTSAVLKKRFKNFAGDWHERFNEGAGADYGSTRLLVVHDRDDHQTSFDTSAALAARQRGLLLSTEGLGHSRLLSDPDTIDSIVGFISVPVTRQR